MERTELALVQRRGTTADKLALLPHEPIRAGWTKSTRRNKTRLLIRRQQAGAAQEPDEEDIVHTRVCPLGVSAISRFLALALTTANLSDTERRRALVMELRRNVYMDARLHEIKSADPDNG